MEENEFSKFKKDFSVHMPHILVFFKKRDFLLVGQQLAAQKKRQSLARCSTHCAAGLNKQHCTFKSKMATVLNGDDASPSHGVEMVASTICLDPPDDLYSGEGDDEEEQVIFNQGQGNRTDSGRSNFCR